MSAFVAVIMSIGIIELVLGDRQQIDMSRHSEGRSLPRVDEIHETFLEPEAVLDDEISAGDPFGIPGRRREIMRVGSVGHQHRHLGDAIEQGLNCCSENTRGDHDLQRWRWHR